MKYVKLIAIFAFVAAGLYFALIRPTASHHTDEGFVDIDQIDINEFNEETKDMWAEKEWDSLIYNDRRGDIEQYRQMGMLSKDGYNSIRNCLFESSVNELCATYKASLKAKSYRSTPTPKEFNSKVNSVYAGVPFLMKKEGIKEENLKNQSRLWEVKQLNDHYTKVFGFVYASIKKNNDYVRSEHGFSPKFDGNNWAAFNSTRDGITAKAEGYKGGNNKALYDEMKTLPGFEEGLSKTWLEGKINPRFDDFYNTLAGQIIDNIRINYAYVVPSDKQCDTIPNMVRLNDNSKVVYVYKDKLSEGLNKLENVYPTFVNQFGRDRQGIGKRNLENLKKDYTTDYNKLPK